MLHNLRLQIRPASNRRRHACPLWLPEKWRPRMELHHRPSGSEPDALLIELQGCLEKWIRQLESHQPFVATKDARRLLRFGGMG